MCIIILLTRKVQLLTRKGKQLTRKVGVNFYGFIFLLKRIFSGNSGIKNVLPIRRKHYCTAALLHDVFRKPHRQSVSLKPKYKAKTSRFLSTLRFLFGASVLTGLNEKCSKIKGFRQSINGINLKIKYFSFQNTLRY